jgi:hypothetical protein
VRRFTAARKGLNNTRNELSYLISIIFFPLPPEDDHLSNYVLLPAGITHPSNPGRRSMNILPSAKIFISLALGWYKPTFQAAITKPKFNQNPNNKRGKR